MSWRSQDVLKAFRIIVIWKVSSCENQVRTQFQLLPFHLSISVYKIDCQEGGIPLCFFCKNWSVLTEWEHYHLNSNFQLPTQMSKFKHLLLRKHFSWSFLKEESHRFTTALNRKAALHFLFTYALAKDPGTSTEIQFELLKWPGEWTEEEQS